MLKPDNCGLIRSVGFQFKLRLFREYSTNDTNTLSPEFILVCGVFVFLTTECFDHFVHTF